MIEITTEFSDRNITKIVRKHINRKTSDIINWYSAINKPSKYLPNGYSDKESEAVIQSLLKIIEDDEIVDLSDPLKQFALSCILEEEERITNEMFEGSATFSDEDLTELKKVLSDEDISYFESYDNFRDLLLTNNDYLDLAEV